jgi:15-cis-phytoene synthase
MQDTAEEIAKGSKSSFYYAFSLLPGPKRDAMNAVYAFCRKTDDIVDEGNDSDDIKYERLRKWRIEFENALKGSSNYQLLNKVGAIIKQFNLPVEPFFELIIGMEMDLQKKRYIKFEDLVEYCYRVASTVGLMCVGIFGYKHSSAKEYAINLGLAMQLTNILRDVKTDAENGRIYLPQEDIARFNYSEKEIMDAIYNPNFVSLMQFEAERAKGFFTRADGLLDKDDKSALFAARAMQHIYQKLLYKLEKEKFDVYNKKIRINNFEKGFISLGVWMKYSIVY